MPHPFTRVNILGVGISAINLEQAVEQLGIWIEQRTQTYVVVCPVYTVMLCHQDPTFRKLVNRAGMVTPDGMPIVFLSRWLGYRTVGRVYGPDLMLALSRLSAQKGYTQFYYGGEAGVAEQLSAVLQKKYPGLHVVGTYSPPFRVLTPDEDQAVVDQINAANPDIVWIGLGSPKQDRWMDEHRAKLNAPILIGVGAAFDFHTGRIAQAPQWMQRHALEWLFRLITEPRRLWKRYLVYNPLFLFHILLQLTHRRVIPLDESDARL